MTDATRPEGKVASQREALARWIALAETPFAPGGLGHELQTRGDAYLAGYVLSTDGADYEPNENERFLLSDAFAGLLCDEALFGPIRALLTALASPTEQASDVSGLVEALRPFAAVLVDVGEEEADDDLYQPMSRAHRRASAITVGDLRRASEALSQAQQGKP